MPNSVLRAGDIKVNKTDPSLRSFKTMVQSSLVKPKAERVRGACEGGMYR